MADNLNVTPGTGATVAADDISGKLYQRIKVGIGADGAATDLAFGQGVKTASLPVTIASDQDTLAVKTVAGALTDLSGTLTTGGSNQQIAAANSSRKYLIIINISTSVLWVQLGGSAVQGSPSIPLAPASVANGYDGGVLVFEGMFVPSGSVQLVGAVTGQAYVAKEG